jgi:tetratricopeptide (TPR) repeat protein
VNVQLINAETGNHLWAERFDKPVADLFDMQDEIVSRLARTLGGQLIVAEARRAERSLHPDATDLTFQGLACLYKGATPEHLTQARGFFERALAIDPRSIRALVGMASVDMNMGGPLLTDDRAARCSAAETRVKKALSLAPDHAGAHLVLGAVLILTKRAAQGIAECERALALDHNSAGAHAEIGLAKVAMGRGAETEAHINEAFRLSPRDMDAYQWLSHVGFAKLQLTADDEAVCWFYRSNEANRNYPPPGKRSSRKQSEQSWRSLSQFGLAAALALLGSLDQARAAAKAGLALNPRFTIRRFRVNALSDDPTYLAKRERVYEGMHLAGVPEG